MTIDRLRGLIAATHTPFDQEGSLNLSIVEKQAERLMADGVTTAFIGGSTGESHSLSLDERRQLAERWFEVTRGTALKVVVHVGSNCLSDAASLARQAQQLGAVAISALAPSYFKPANVDALVECCSQVARAASETPFYFYDIPSMTGVNLPMPEFLSRASDSIPNLAGLKFTNVDLMSYQLCRALDSGRFDILWGVDELLLAALSFGAQGAVGSTYNFAAPVYHRVLAAFDRSDLDTARREQLRSVRLVQILVAQGYMASAKAFMLLRGVDVGPPRLPHRQLSEAQQRTLQQNLESEGFLD